MERQKFEGRNLKILRSEPDIPTIGDPFSDALSIYKRVGYTKTDKGIYKTVDPAISIEFSTQSSSNKDKPDSYNISIGFLGQSATEIESFGNIMGYSGKNMIQESHVEYMYQRLLNRESIIKKLSVQSVLTLQESHQRLQQEQRINPSDFLNDRLTYDFFNLCHILMDQMQENTPILRGITKTDEKQGIKTIGMSTIFENLIRTHANDETHYGMRWHTPNKSLYNLELLSSKSKNKDTVILERTTYETIQHGLARGIPVKKLHRWEYSSSDKPKHYELDEVDHIRLQNLLYKPDDEIVNSINKYEREMKREYLLHIPEATMQAASEGLKELQTLAQTYSL